MDKEFVDEEGVISEEEQDSSKDDIERAFNIWNELATRFCNFNRLYFKKPGLHPNKCFENNHTKVDYKKDIKT